MTAEDEAREKLLAKYGKYNRSKKGQRRNRKYESEHPDRKLRWEAARNETRSDRIGGLAENHLGSPPAGADRHGQLATPC